jgi:AcrR family transcriptional regulator
MNNCEAHRVSMPSSTGKLSCRPRAPRRRGRPAKDAPCDGTGLLQAAAAAFAEHGFEGATLRGIAAAAGVDPALISYRYGGKAALWQAVIEEFAEEVLTTLRCVAAGPQDRLTALVDALCRLSCRRPDIARLMIREATCPAEGERTDLLRDLLTRPLHDVMLPLVAEAEALRPPEDRADPEVRLFAMLGALCMVLSTRPALAAFTDIAADETRLREELLRSLRLPVCASFSQTGLAQT